MKYYQHCDGCVTTESKNDKPPYSVVFVEDWDRGFQNESTANGVMYPNNIEHRCPNVGFGEFVLTWEDGVAKLTDLDGKPIHHFVLD